MAQHELQAQKDSAGKSVLSFSMETNGSAPSRNEFRTRHENPEAHVRDEANDCEAAKQFFKRA